MVFSMNEIRNYINWFHEKKNHETYAWEKVIFDGLFQKEDIVSRYSYRYPELKNCSILYVLRLNKSELERLERKINGWKKLTKIGEKRGYNRFDSWHPFHNRIAAFYYLNHIYIPNLQYDNIDGQIDDSFGDLCYTIVNSEKKYIKELIYQNYNQIQFCMKYTEEIGSSHLFTYAVAECSWIPSNKENEYIVFFNLAEHFII